jgi:hypothetical protein
MPRQPYIVVCSTPPIEKVLGLGGPVALSPVAPLVAETGKSPDGDILRITNYQTAEIVGQSSIPCSMNHTLSFSPDGKLLFAMPGFKGTWKTLFVYAEPWSSPPIICDTLGSTFHGAWLDERTMLISGTLKEELYIAVLDVSTGDIEIVHQEGTQPFSSFNERHLDSVCCSPSGLVVFAIGYGRRIALYQLNEQRTAIVPERSITTRYDGYGQVVAVAEDGQTILCGAGLFNRQGQLLTPS